LKLEKPFTEQTLMHIAKTVMKSSYIETKNGMVEGNRIDA